MANKRLRLKYDTPTNIRKSITKINNMVANGELDCKVANTIIVGCNAILGSIRVDDQEKKIRELGALLEHYKKQKEDEENN